MIVSVAHPKAHGKAKAMSNRMLKVLFIGVLALSNVVLTLVLLKNKKNTNSLSPTDKVSE